MIPKGLKVGDTFKDEGATFKVLEVVGENYNSVRVGSSLPAADVEQPKEEISEPKDNIQEREDYSSMQYAQLKKLCAERGLVATGKKADLIARLEG